MVKQKAEDAKAIDKRIVKEFETAGFSIQWTRTDGIRISMKDFI